MYKKYYLFLLFAISLLTSCEFVDKANSLMEKRASKTEVVKLISSHAELATAEVFLRKVVYLDDENKKYAIITKDNIGKLLYGSKHTILPIRGTLYFGFDLNDFSSKNIEVTPDSTLMITLPRPKLLRKEFELDVENSVSYAPGRRKRYSTSELYEAKDATEEIIIQKSDSILAIVQDNVIQNAKSVFECLLQKSGWEILILVENDAKNKNSKK